MDESALCKILIEIEDLRSQLKKMLEAKPPLDPEVIALSKKLDLKLNAYDQLLKKQNK